MEPNANALNWFEIPVSDFNRAITFYEKIFSTKLQIMPEMMGMKMAGFPIDMASGKVGGALAHSNFHKPAMDGAVIYLNANPDIQTIINRVESAGGKMLMPKTQVSPEIGYMAFFVDTEGNRVGLHAQN